MTSLHKNILYLIQDKWCCLVQVKCQRLIEGHVVWYGCVSMILQVSVVGMWALCTWLTCPTACRTSSPTSRGSPPSSWVGTYTHALKILKLTFCEEKQYTCILIHLYYLPLSKLFQLCVFITLYISFLKKQCERFISDWLLLW